jgi:undecaprenyl-diphosphatase
LEPIALEITQIVLLAIVQGLSELLPISSSGHLVLTPLVFGYELQSLAFDVALHIGTLAAVMAYFRREIAAMLGAFLESLAQRRIVSPDARLAWMIVVATLPLVALGLPLKALLEMLRGDEQLITLVIGCNIIGFGLLLGIGDRLGRRDRDEFSVGWRQALIIGLCQAIAIIPGTSRSGVTMTAALFLGLTRKAAARFSFLLSIPAILMAGSLSGLELIQSVEPVDWQPFLLGALIAFAVAYLTIHFFLTFIERIGMMPFVIYRLLVGAFILLVVV